MNTYVKPIAVESSDMFEGVFAMSNDKNGIKGWAIWDNHNSGSHSDIFVFIQTPANYVGMYLKITAYWMGKGSILAVGGYSGPANASWDGDKTITFQTTEKFNANETVQFGFNNVVFSETGDEHDTSVHKGSYYETETHVKVEAGEWLITVGPAS